MTKREMFEELIKVVTASECENKDILLVSLHHEIELLDRKASKPSATQVRKEAENKALRDGIVAVLAKADHAMSVTELLDQEDIQDLGIRTPQKMTALLYADDRIVKTVDKRKSYFSVERQ